MANASDVVIYAGLGALAAYVTNFMGFKVWADTHIVQQPPIPPVGPEPPYVEPPPGGADPQPPIQNDPPPRPGNTFNCVSYPRCNTVSGTDARKLCCCKNKCSLMKKSNQTMNPTFSGNMCLCNFRTISTTPPTKCLGPCALGTFPKLVNGRCTCARCTNTCSGCYDRVANCGCKLNTGKLAYNSGNCQISCGNRTCWTNVPCGGSSKVKVCVDGNSCTTAKNAWLAKYACKTPATQCPYAGCTSLPRGSTCFYCRCAKLCGSRGVREVKSDGSCYCKPLANIAQIQSYSSNIRPHEAMDEGLMQVPTIA